MPGTFPGSERFKAIVLWLPTWHDVREILETLEVSNEEVAAALRDRGAIERHQELLVLHEMIAERLPRSLAVADSMTRCSLICPPLRNVAVRPR